MRRSDAGRDRRAVDSVEYGLVKIVIAGSVVGRTVDGRLPGHRDVGPERRVEKSHVGKDRRSIDRFVRRRIFDGECVVGSGPGVEDEDDRRGSRGGVGHDDGTGIGSDFDDVGPAKADVGEDEAEIYETDENPLILIGLKLESSGGVGALEEERRGRADKPVGIRREGVEIGEPRDGRLNTSTRRGTGDRAVLSGN
jgi:hypothetical protein